MKSRNLLISLCIVSLMTFSPLVGVNGADATDPQPGDPVVTGSSDLVQTVQVFPYDVDIFGIYLVEGGQMTPVTSVSVDHVNADRVTAKLSPDGFKVAYLVEFGGTGFSQLVVVGVDGLNSRILYDSDDPEQYITSFAWSHDSLHLAYTVSRDPFAAPDDLVASFDDPDAEIDPNEATTAFEDPLELTGEVWLTDLNGDVQEQIVESGAMEVLGWSGDDTGVLFTRYIVDPERTTTRASDEVTATRTITPYSSFSAGVSMARIADAEVSDLLTNTVPQSGTLSGPLYTGFYLLEDGAGSQSLAVVGTALPFQTLPVTDTVLSVASLSGALGRQGDLVLTPVLTNSQSIIDVSVSPDGSQVAYLTEQAGALWAAGIDGLNHTEIITGGLSTNANLVWSSGNDALAAMSSGQPSLQVVDLSGAALGSLSVVSSEALNAEPLGAHVVRNYNVPFIHQLWDTPNWFGGYCACGPTSTAMSLAFYDKLSPHRITISSPYHHTNDYGFYVAEKFGSFRSRSVLECPGSQRAFGLYGYTMDYGRFAWAWRMQRAIERFGIRTTFDGSATLNEIKAALNRGHLVILSTRLTGAGHVVLVRGYTSDNRLIVNDPYGNKFAGTYGKSVIDGANERYAWNRIGAKWFIEVHGTPPGGDQPNITHWRGAYYNNRTLSGRPSVVRNDTRIDFDWGSGAPASGISSDNFSVRWRRTMRFERGVYRFRVISDDGARLYVDGRRILNVWWDQPPTNYYADVYLRSGNHTIRLDYYEHGGVARSKLWWSRIGSSPSWSAEYYNNRNLSGGPTFTRNERSIYHNWRDGGPGNGVGNDNFSVRWRGNIWTPGGAVRFFTRTDDGVRLWVDGNRHISRWRDQARTTVFRSRRLSRGTHSVRMDYYEHLGVAYARMWYQPVFYVQYYNNRHLSGSPSWRGYNSRINYVWGYGSPNSQIRNYNFSARWTANQYFSGGRYRFCTRTDDGVRLYIDGVRVINRWQDQATRTYCTSRTLSRGHHHIRMEYYEHYGWARARLRWRRYGSTSTSGALTRGEEPPADADVLALYGDAGYLGPLTEADVGAEGEEVVHEAFIPVVLTSW